MGTVRVLRSYVCDGSGESRLINQSVDSSAAASGQTGGSSIPSTVSECFRCCNTSTGRSPWQVALVSESNLCSLSLRPPCVADKRAQFCLSEPSTARETTSLRLRTRFPPSAQVHAPFSCATLSLSHSLASTLDLMLWLENCFWLRDRACRSLAQVLPRCLRVAVPFDFRAVDGRGFFPSVDRQPRAKCARRFGTCFRGWYILPCSTRGRSLSRHRRTE